MSAPDRILDAAATIMREQGIARATTKEIARVAGCSEALLYKHFRDKTQIFLGVLSERSPNLSGVLAEVAERAGTGTVEEHLRTIARSAMEFYAETFVLAAGLFSDRSLLQSHRAALAEYGAGPRVPHAQLTAYLRDEQKRGRIRPDADPDASASLLLGGCFQQAFFSCFEGEPLVPDDHVDGLVATLLDSIGS